MATDVSTVDQASYWITHLDIGLDMTAVGGTKQWHAYDYDDVPETLPALYAEISLSRRFGDDFRLTGQRKLVGYRLFVRHVGKTIDGARTIRDRVVATLADNRFEIDGRETTLVRFETETDIEPDDGWYSGATAWTYAL